MKRQNFAILEWMHLKECDCQKLVLHSPLRLAFYVGLSTRFWPIEDTPVSALVDALAGTFDGT